ncbi:hypothetical protein QBC47DRAFT_302774 [Echria macrotheca]|uniref:Carrier domain-containing protein n=1 Tax=Echria macrotheca TaxID=438768 RepID=A0AAJ0B9Y0_9PEZI|nr:hypothetical protein QBC47DRAFT_302774 [Echria macrotheca]
MRSFPEVVEQLAAEDPNGVWIKFPRLSSGRASWADITFDQLHRAVNTMAHWINENLDFAQTNMKNQVVAYIGINDARYPIIIIASIKNGHKILLTSPRNSLENHLSLLRSTRCTRLLFSKEYKNEANRLCTEISTLRAAQVPDLDEILNDPTGSSYINWSIQDTKPITKDTTLMILHSSGSTGSPKPIEQKAGIWHILDNSEIWAHPSNGRRYVLSELYGTRLIVATVPFFHSYGINLLTRSIYHKGPLVLLSPDRPPTVEIVLEAIEQTNPSAIVSVPSLLEDMVALSSGLVALSRMELVFSGGAPLAKACGDKIAARTRLVNCIGSTETYFNSNYIPLSRDWEYFEWDPLAGIKMETNSDNCNLAEMVIKRSPDMLHQFVFCNYSDKDEWRTKDLYEKHATEPGLWRYVGRTDDIIVLRNGEKINPVPFEKVVETHPKVKSALMVGTERFQAGIIIEPNGLEISSIREYINLIWPSIEQANSKSPAHARVFASMVAIASPDKPFRRSPKGSIMRRATYQLYEREIDALYRDNAVDGTLINPRDTETLIRQAVESILSCSEALTPDTNLFTIGMDSVQVLELSRSICRLTGIDCSPKTIYTHRTIASLAQNLSPLHSHTSSLLSREEKMSFLIHKYTNDLPYSCWRVVNWPKPPQSELVVILTGSTGSLGTHILYELLKSSQISRIHCLNRSQDAATRQKQLLSSLRPGAQIANSLQKAEYHTADFSQQHLGLTKAVYDDLLASAQVFIHNAWPVDFNKSLEEFEGMIRGTRTVVDFAMEAKFDLRVIYVTSVAGVMNWGAVRTEVGDELVIPERFEPDNSLPAKQGYGESKHVASCILNAGAKRMDLNITLIRSGQLSGPKDSTWVWAQHEWFPSLIRTSKVLGKLPNSLGQHDIVDWVPVDVAGQAVLELSLQAPRQLGEVNCFNMVNPRTAKWGDLALEIKQYFNSKGEEMEVVTLQEWMKELKEVGMSKDLGELCHQYPAFKLLDFFQGLENNVGKLRFATTLAEEYSPTMRKLEATDGNLMRKWLETM